MRKLLINYSLYSHPEISGCDSLLHHLTHICFSYTSNIQIVHMVFGLLYIRIKICLFSALSFNWSLYVRMHAVICTGILSTFIPVTVRDG
jgi:hypothetical protein